MIVARRHFYRCRRQAQIVEISSLVGGVHAQIPSDETIRPAGGGARQRVVQHVESVGVLPNFSRMGSGVGQGVAAAAIERAHVYADHRKGVKTPPSRRVDQPECAGSGHRDDARGKSASGRENRSVRPGEAVLRRRLHGSGGEGQSAGGRAGW